ncbi:alpha/beta hydrolase [Cohnella lubricantis]|uniref:alpha/beta hydrolase n=1 Tax=Cohnella lubricantis TaxID=2163172 RepID=UPI0028938329|nr:alpha/beta hydrolase [Cohnella lubricantis]MBP2118175.1 fermentation-respiration switch protein FrsA (DUF1100 family) [Cohnella lubricantis]
MITLIAASLHFYQVAVSRKGNKKAMSSSPDLEQDDNPFTPPEVMAWVREQPLEDVSIVSHDGLTLRGYYLPASRPSDRTVILAHGYTGDAIGNMSALAKLYHESLGYNVLMPDARGHGRSDGEYIGFGWHERKDYGKWIDYVIGRVGAGSQIVLHGISMGGATVLMASGEKLPDQVRGIVSDCAYTSAKDILSYQLKRLFKLPAVPFVPLTSLVCRLRAGYLFGEASAEKQVARSTKPILFIHGEADTFVPFEMVHRLYDSCVSIKEKLVIPNAGHAVAYFTDRELYAGALRSFLGRFVHDRSAAAEESRVPAQVNG